MKKVVVTGATGFIGVHLVRLLVNRGYSVICIVRPGSRNIAKLPKNDNITVLPVEMSDYDKIQKEAGDIDAFYHLSWDGSRGKDRDDRQLQLKNFYAAKKAFKSAVNMNAGLFLSVGSQAECGDMGDKIVDENFPCSPVSRYGTEKLHTYEELTSMAKRSDTRFVWTRVFSLYGPYDYENSLVISTIKNLREGKPVETTLAKQYWDFLYVEDAVRAMADFIDSDLSGLYNLASGKSRPLRGYIEDIRTVVNPCGEIIYGAIPYPSDGKPVRFRPSIEKIKKDTGWNPRTEFKDGIAKIYDSIKKGV